MREKKFFFGRKIVKKDYKRYIFAWKLASFKLTFCHSSQIMFSFWETACWKFDIYEQIK